MNFRFYKWKQQDYNAKLTGKPAITVGSIGLDSSFLSGEGHQIKQFENVERVSSDEIMIAVSYEVCDGQVTPLDELERRLEADEFDLAAVGRTMIPNPDWPRLLQEGRLSEIRNFDKTDLIAL